MPNWRGAIARAISEVKQIRITYVDSHHRTEEFQLDPNYLFKHHNKLYMIAFNHTHDDIRIFRLSRIKTLTTTDTQSVRYPIRYDTVNFGHYFMQQDIQMILSPKMNQKSASEYNFDVSNARRDSEYPQRIQLSKMTRAGLCRSPLEKKVLNELNSASNVRQLAIEPFSIPYQFQGTTRNYIPDVMVLYNDGCIDIIEIKLSGEISLPINQAKFKAATAECNKRGCRFKIMGIEGGASKYGSNPQWSQANESSPIQKFEPDFEVSQFVRAEGFTNPSNDNTLRQTNPKNNPRKNYGWIWWLIFLCVLGLGLLAVLELS